jgi:hypothetical protein
VLLRQLLEAVSDHPYAFILLCLGLNVVLSGLRVALVRAGGNLLGMFRIVVGKRRDE